MPTTTRSAGPSENESASSGDVPKSSVVISLVSRLTATMPRPIPRSPARRTFDGPWRSRRSNTTPSRSRRFGTREECANRRAVPTRPSVWPGLSHGPKSQPGSCAHA
jgi:hypothetical protein